MRTINIIICRCLNIVIKINRITEKMQLFLEVTFHLYQNNIRSLAVVYLETEVCLHTARDASKQES